MDPLVLKFDTQCFLAVGGYTDGELNRGPGLI